MNGSSFTPRLESLSDRLCLSTVSGSALVYAPSPGAESSLIGLLHTGDHGLLVPAVHDGSNGGTTAGLTFNGTPADFGGPHVG